MLNFRCSIEHYGCLRFTKLALLNSLRGLLVPAYAQVCFMKTDRRIIVATSAHRPSSAIMSSGVFRMSERWIWERKFRHGIRSVSCSAP
jgi:hypothetical protein